MSNPRFFSAERNKKPWQIIVIVDQSGSMISSLIHSSVMASIFAELPSIKTNLIAFDTTVVDLSDKVNDPVEVLMSVNLGGGTDITNALRFAQSLVKKPKKTIMVLITDFYEGRDDSDLINEIRFIKEAGIKILGLASLNEKSVPDYNVNLTKKIASLGVDVLVATPDKLCELIADTINY
ncbi:MAG: VWA domain-containing protein [Promethearchaeota archaeon]